MGFQLVNWKGSPPSVRAVRGSSPVGSDTRDVSQTEEYMNILQPRCSKLNKDLRGIQESNLFVSTLAYFTFSKYSGILKTADSLNGIEFHIPYRYLISRVFNFAFFAIVKESRN